jgi:hypothetical protein
LYAAVKLLLRILQSNSNQYSTELFDETKYPNEEAIAPGTLLLLQRNVLMLKVVEPVLQRDGGLYYYINLSR